MRVEAILREADKQNYNNNGPDDNEDYHQCPIWPSWHHKGESLREREEKSVKCLESWIRYIWLQNILRHETTVPGPGEGDKTWVGHGVTCQMPTNITFTDNFCFLSKVLRNTSQQRPGTPWKNFQFLSLSRQIPPSLVWKRQGLLDVLGRRPI